MVSGSKEVKQGPEPKAVSSESKQHEESLPPGPGSLWGKEHRKHGVVDPS